MKRLWAMISFLAVVNLIALLGFTGWLVNTQRLDQSRIDTIRELLRTPIPEAEAAAEVAAAAARDSQRAAAEAARRDNPLPPSDERIAQLSSMTMLEEDAEQAGQARAAAMAEQLRHQTRALREQERAFNEARDAWERDTATARQQRIDEQFQQVVKLYESIPAKQAKGMLLSLVEAGEVDQAVAYLDAMAPRSAAKIIRELKSAPEQILATSLLESLRTFGVGAKPAAETPDSSADEPDLDQPESRRDNVAAAPA